MRHTHAGADIIRFTPPPAASAHLSLRDRMDVAAWRDPAHNRGYDRLIIHERVELDPPGLEAFLGIYRHGEQWASWNLARCGAGVLAWCSRSSVDIGRFATVGEALEALLSGATAGSQRAVLS